MAIRQIDEFPPEERTETDEPLEVVEYKGEQFVKVRRITDVITWEKVSEIEEKRAAAVKQKEDVPVDADKEIADADALLAIVPEEPEPIE